MLIGIVLISLVGTLGHFLYDITNHNKIIGLFASVNESTWEHIKIALTPTFLWSIVDGFLYGNNSNYFVAKLLSLLSIIVIIPLIYYSYQLILKRRIVFIDVSSFYISIIISQWLFKYIIEFEVIGYLYSYLSCVGLFVLFGFYMVLTLLPIKNFIFKDPITDKYGFKGHK